MQSFIVCNYLQKLTMLGAEKIMLDYFKRKIANLSTRLPFTYLVDFNYNIHFYCIDYLAEYTNVRNSSKELPIII